tara:strand:+ start:164 stop:274 length:111 start_codon:yes stop_codon:yes gene_type:complete
MNNKFKPLFKRPKSEFKPLLPEILKQIKNNKNKDKK